jgi:hypothetical protein
VNAQRVELQLHQESNPLMKNPVARTPSASAADGTPGIKSIAPDWSIPVPMLLIDPEAGAGRVRTIASALELGQNTYPRAEYVVGAAIIDHAHANEVAAHANVVAGTERVLQELAGMKLLIDPEARSQEAGVAAAKAQTALKQIESAAEITVASRPLLEKLEVIATKLDAMEAGQQAMEAGQKAMEARQQAMEARQQKIENKCCVVM